MGGNILLAIVSLVHFFRNIKHPEKSHVSLRMSSGNMNASGVVTCQYP